MNTAAEKFPYPVKLLSAPDNARDASILTVGTTYVAVARAGSCLQVSTNVKGRWALVWSGRFEKVASAKDPRTRSNKKVKDETTARSPLSGGQLDAAVLTSKRKGAP